MSGFKELVERCTSDKWMGMEHKKNLEKVQNIRACKYSGILSANPEITSLIEDRIAQLHTDDLDQRKNFCMHVLAEETQLVFLFTGMFGGMMEKRLVKSTSTLCNINHLELLGEAIFGICAAEQIGLQKILDGWHEMRPMMEKLKIN